MRKKGFTASDKSPRQCQAMSDGEALYQFGSQTLRREQAAAN